MHTQGQGRHQCVHHKLATLLILLAWLAAIGFWYTAYTGKAIAWMDSDHLFKDVVILSLLAFGSKFCPCGRGYGLIYGHGAMMKGGICGHGEGCSCGDCDRCK